MRLFVAIDIDELTRVELRRVRRAIEQRLASAHRPPRVTWVADDAAHVTVRFIGEINEATGERVRAALEAPISRPPYDLEFAGLGAFPSQGRPRVLWMGARNGQDESAQVAAAVNARLDPIVGASEDRPFRVHLTVGRVKESLPFAWEEALSAVDVRRTVSRVDHVTLYQSTTSPRGPAYTALCATPLTAGAPA